MTKTFTISSGTRFHDVRIVSERNTARGNVVQIKRLRDAGADQSMEFNELRWNLTKRGDFCNILRTVLDRRTKAVR